MLRPLLHPAFIWWLALGWTVFMAVGCFWPSSGLPNIGNNDKVLHVLIFIPFAAGWSLSGKSFWWTLATGVAYGGLIEVVQESIPAINRAGDWLDFAADAVGVLLGLALGQALRWLRK